MQPAELLISGPGFHKSWDAARSSGFSNQALGMLFKTEKTLDTEYFGKTYSAMLQQVPDILQFYVSVSNIEDGLTHHFVGSVDEMIAMFKEHMQKDKREFLSEYVKNHQSFLQEKIGKTVLPGTYISYGLVVPSLRIVVAADADGGYTFEKWRLPKFLVRSA